MKIQRISIFILSLTWGVFFYFLINTDIASKLDSMGDAGMFPLLVPIGAALLSVLYRLKLVEGEVDSDEITAAVFWGIGAFLVIPGLILPFRKMPQTDKPPPLENRKTPGKKTGKTIKKQTMTNDKIQALIKERGLRPLGNKKRLTHTDSEYNVRLYLFDEKIDATLYYNTLIEYARKNPPPVPVEIMLVRIHTIYDEPYGLAFPKDTTDTREKYVSWIRDAILTSNETIRDYQPADHNYEMLNQYVKKLYNWTILIPASYNMNITDKDDPLTDPSGEGYTALKF